MARAERPRGACPECGKDCAITDEGGVRHHFTEDPDKQAGPDSRKCRGTGQPPAGDQPSGSALSFLCRVPSGPGGCGHQVHLTANFRARTHLTPQGEPCAEGSSAPPIAVGPNGYRADTADWTEADWARAFPKREILPAARPEDLLIEPDRDFDPRPVETVGGPDRIDPHAQEADAAIAAVESLQREQDAAYEQSVRDGLAESRRKIHDSVPLLNRSEPTALIPELKTAVGDPGTVMDKDPRLHQVFCQHEYSGHDVWDEQNGTEANVEACVKCGLIEPDETAEEIARIKTLPPDERGPAVDALFDETHEVPTDLGPETHPGKAADCTLLGCCTHPDGFQYGDDGNGHSGDVCMICGLAADAIERPGPDDWKTPADLLARMPGYVQELAATNPECWDCEHGVTPLVDRFGPDGSAKHIVWSCREDCQHAERRPSHYGRPCRPQHPAQDRLGSLDEGVLFVRHTLKPPLNQLVYRAGKPTMGPLTATVVTAGPHAGKTGSLTDLQEEITCTDLNGTPRPRRGRTASGTPPEPAGPGASTSPTPSAPARTADRPTGPRSTPLSTPTVTSPAATSTVAPSSRATRSAPTETAAGSTPSTRRTTLPDAFSTAKQAVNESDRYDSYGRYKLKNPDDPRKNVKWTRATTFAKSVQDTYALSMWSQRMVLKGASLRKDIVAAVSTLEVKADKDRVNSLVEDAKKAAGDKVAANKGTAVHAYTEDRDLELVGMPHKAREVPEEFVPTVQAYEATLKAFGLEPVPGLIEFTTAVKQYEVAGTSDRVYKVTRDITFKLNGRTVTLYAGEYVIGDVKTGADLSYGWQEIAIQLALYAQGLNTSGVWSWTALSWGKPTLPDNPEVLLKVRTDVGLVPHLPVDRSTTGAPLATLYAVDLDAGWAAAVLCAQVRSWRKERKLATPLEIADVVGGKAVPVTLVGNAQVAARGSGPEALSKDVQPPVSRSVVASRPVTLEDKARAVTSRAEASAVFQEAVAARVSRAELDKLTGIMQKKLASFVEQGA